MGTKQKTIKIRIMTKSEKELHNDIKRVATAMEKLVKLLTKIIKDNA